MLILAWFNGPISWLVRESPLINLGFSMRKDVQMLIAFQLFGEFLGASLCALNNSFKLNISSKKHLENLLSKWLNGVETLVCLQ